MDGVSIYQRFDSMQHELDALIDSLHELGEKLAGAEKDYRIEKRKAELYYRDKGYPASMLGDLAKGQSDIAELAYMRDVAQYAYDATREAVMAKKLGMNILRDIYRNEYGRS